MAPHHRARKPSGLLSVSGYAPQHLVLINDVGGAEGPGRQLLLPLSAIFPCFLPSTRVIEQKVHLTPAFLVETRNW